MKKYQRHIFTIYLLVFSLISSNIFAQLTQNLKGIIREKETQKPLAGVFIIITDLSSEFNATTDDKGFFTIQNVPLGKHDIEMSQMGFNTITLQQVLFTSGKEVVLELNMETSAQSLETVVVSGKKESVNEMAIVSIKKFDVSETERYAGSRGDPARMASNYAGVQGADDSRNDIIVRGNSPQGVLWQLEDVPIPNPNHFSIPGTTGGPVGIINNKTLANSDFITGAFPAGYGNAIGGVFDIKMRNGNFDLHEASAQFGFLGTELAVEGPISRKNKSTYLATYRYSTLRLFEKMNIKIGTNSIPNYQDGAFKLNFPIGSKSNFSIFGLGGLSNIDLIVSTLTEPSQELYGEDDRDQYFRSNTGLIGAAFQTSLSDKSLFKIVVSQNANQVIASHDKVFRNAQYQVDSLKDILGYTYRILGTSSHAFLNHKFTNNYILKSGIIHTYYNLLFIDSSRQYPVTRQDWVLRNDYKGSTHLLQPYTQFKWRHNNNLVTTYGLHAQYLSHNGSFAIEPRLGLKYQIDNNQAINFGYGLHSQMQPLYQYFSFVSPYSDKKMSNADLGFTRSHHLVLGYDRYLSRVWRLRAETYYQYLYNIPIEKRLGSSFSGVNQGNTFSRLFPDELYNKGTGYNYGVELTLEKQFSHDYFLLFTGSLFDSKAKGNDGKYRNTDYNTKYALNALVGYEKKLGSRFTLTSGLKLSMAGGRLYSPPDTAASATLGDLVVIDSLRNTLRFKDYFRIDLKMGFRYNAPRVAHELGVDLVNVLNTKNILSLYYNPELAAQGSNPFVASHQLGFLPLFYYRADFTWGRKKQE